MYLDVKEFFLQNRYLSQYAGQKRDFRGKRRKYVYRKIFSNTNKLTTFQCDLFSTSKKFVSKGNLYSLFVIDTNSRFLFHYNLKKRNSKQIVQAFKQIMKTIRSYKDKIMKGIKSVDFLTFIR